MQLRSLPAAMALLASLPLYSITASGAALEPVTVTATRTAQTVDDALASVTVISREQIEQLQSQSLQDLLRGVAGLDVANSGGMGKETSVFMRGTESGHVLVLIDGVKIGSATLGSVAFQDIPVAQIERIEIVRGPRSSLYGAEAIGGVIQIFTRKGKGPIKPSFSVGAGSYGTYKSQAGVAGGSDNSWFSANLNNINTSGFNACRGSYTTACYTFEPDKDGYHNVAASLNGGYHFSNGVTAELNALRSEGNNKSDGYPNESSTVQQALGGKVHLSPSQAWQMTLAAGQSRDESDSFKDSSFTGSINTRRDTATWQNDITVGNDRLLTVGLDRQVDHVENTTPYAISSRGNTALFTQYQGAISVIDTQVSLRRDDNELYGSNTTGGLALGTELGKGLRGILSYGTAFKAPTFNGLYWPHMSYTDTDSGITYISHGNPLLSPEKSKTVEVGLRYTLTTGSYINLSAYETTIRNLISWTTNATGPNEYTSTPDNVGMINIRGLEATHGTHFGEWALKTNLTLLNPQNRANGANYGNQLPRRAKQSLRVDADRTLGAYQLGASLRTESQRYDNLANSRRMGGYATVDLRAGYDITKAWQLQGRIENLLDKGYETAAFYNQPGRSLFVTLRYQP